MLIFDCSFIAENVERRFRFYGEVEVKAEGNSLDFSNLTIFEVVNEVEKPFQITATTWVGTALNAEDALADVISRWTRFEAGFEVFAVAEEIHLLCDKYRFITLVVGERNIPYKILYGTSLEEYDLGMVTDKYTYYTRGCDQFLMLHTDTGEVISDNYFAECGLVDSISAVETEEDEKLLYAGEGVLEE